MEKDRVPEYAQRSNRPALAASPWVWLSVAIFSVLILMLSDPWSIQRSACTICPFIILAGGVGCVCAAIGLKSPPPLRVYSQSAPEAAIISQSSPTHY